MSEQLQLLYSANGLLQECRRQSIPISKYKVDRVLEGIDEDGTVRAVGRDVKAWKWKTFTDAKEAFENAQQGVAQFLKGSGKDDIELLELVKQEKRENIIKKKLDNEQTRSELVHRDEVLEYLCRHQSIICSVLRFYLLNKIPNDLKDPVVRQKCLTMYNEIIGKVQDSIKQWTSENVRVEVAVAKKITDAVS